MRILKGIRPVTFKELKTRLQTFSGFDLEDEQAGDLINQGRRQFALRSRYPKKIVNLGSTVDGTASYDWPADLLLPIWIAVGGGEPWDVADAETIRQYETSQSSFFGIGAWYDAPGEDGTRKLKLYPTPGSALAIELEYVFRPEPLVNASDEPSEIPAEFHEAFLFSASVVYYETIEDNPELAQRNQEKLDLKVNELGRYDNERRAGRGIFFPTLGFAA